MSHTNPAKTPMAITKFSKTFQLKSDLSILKNTLIITANIANNFRMDFLFNTIHF
ncbi:protein of unknown function [Chryseobacterium sp. JV274]|nr:protein of unknown function [Chryseobacterium sp. JV274]